MTLNTVNEKVLTPDERKYILALSQTEGVGPRRFLALIRKFKSAKKVFNSPYTEVAKVVGIKSACLISSGIIFQEIDSLADLLKKNDVGYLTIFDSEYPVLLKEIYDPPAVLYFTGDYKSQDFDKSISVVGTRLNTDYGTQSARKIVQELVEAGFTIISGMAFGIDSCAHKAAIDFEGRTVAVLPCDVHMSSPRANYYLYKKIKKNGCIISEYMFQKEIPPGLFPSRNRIIAGISWGTLVVEAPEKSGALITSRCALDQGREVFAVPGNIFSLKSKGTNNLIEKGEAKLVQNATDILEEYGIVYKDKNVNNTVHTQEEKEIIELLQRSSANIDEIALKMKSDVSKISQVISMMEVRGEVVKSPDGKYMLVL